MLASRMLYDPQSASILVDSRTKLNYSQFWNVKVVSQRPTSISSVDDSDVPEVAEEEQHETPASLKEKQVAMEQQVYRIWTYVSSPPFFFPRISLTSSPAFFRPLKSLVQLVFPTCYGKLATANT